MSTPRARYCHWCPTCRKQAYASRREARQVRKRIPTEPGRGPLNAYPCPATVGYWHLGHLPAIPEARDTLRQRRAGGVA